ncbi:GNAT family N-acetyltransferase [Pseudorhodoplanes sp.]|uniref:GNAT family N-acetyltransferase n=1 Tax=Pseudorhodoplanes sp. TaxID=1934341 RepID=UPI003D0C8560
MNFALARTEHASPLPAPVATDGKLGAVEVALTMEAAEPAWRSLLAQDGFGTAYQDFDLCALWFRHVGRPAGFEPFVVIGRNAVGDPLFLWPLVRRTVGGCRVASFFLGRHANSGSVLWRRDVAQAMSLPELEAILRRMAGGIDALALHNQPRALLGLPNPLLLLPHQDAPDQSYSVTLHGSGDDILARRFNADSRRKLRRKERHLSALPGYRYVRATSSEQVERCISEFLKQKAARLAARGIGNAFDEPGMETFLRAASREGLTRGEPLIEIHSLECETEILALFAGIHDRHCFSTMFNSYTLGEHARMSPGITLLLKLIDDCARRGFETLNLGIGAAEYKSTLCDIAERPFDSFIGLTMRGRVLSLASRAVQSLKGAVKSNPKLWDAYSSARKRLFSNRRSAKP